MRISSADWFKAGVARQRADPISLGISPRACTILSKLLLLLLLLAMRLLSGILQAATIVNKMAPHASSNTACLSFSVKIRRLLALFG